jgi:hypothetical protein
MKKKLFLLVATLMAIGQNAFAYQFSSVAPSGQTLYYDVWWDGAHVTYQALNWDVSSYYSGLAGDLVIPDSVLYDGTWYTVVGIDSGCFRGCTALTSIAIPFSMKLIEFNAFANCTGLTTINYNADSCGFGWYGWDGSYSCDIFEGCTNVATINIGDRVRYVPAFLFYDCTGLQTLTVGHGVQFFNRDALPYVPNNFTTLNYNATQCHFYSSNDGHGHTYSVWTDNGYEERYFKELSPFQDCNALVNVNIGPDVTVLARYFFNECLALTNVIVPNGVTEMANCFEYCTNLRSVTLGSSVEDMGSAFNGCSHLTTIRSLAEYPPICNAETFVGVPAYADIIVPCGAAYRYQLSDYWNTFSRITEDCDAIDGVDALNAKVCSSNGQIVVKDTYGNMVTLYDVNGRVLATKQDNDMPLRFDASVSGTYMIKIGNYPARKVVVIR